MTKIVELAGEPSDDSRIRAWQVFHAACQGVGHSSFLLIKTEIVGTHFEHKSWLPVSVLISTIGSCRRPWLGSLRRNSNLWSSGSSCKRMPISGWLLQKLPHRRVAEKFASHRDPRVGAMLDRKSVSACFSTKRQSVSDHTEWPLKYWVYVSSYAGSPDISQRKDTSSISLILGQQVSLLFYHNYTDSATWKKWNSRVQIMQVLWNVTGILIFNVPRMGKSPTRFQFEEISTIDLKWRKHAYRWIDGYHLCSSIAPNALSVAFWVTVKPIAP